MLIYSSSAAELLSLTSTLLDELLSYNVSEQMQKCILMRQILVYWDLVYNFQIRLNFIILIFFILISFLWALKWGWIWEELIKTISILTSYTILRSNLVRIRYDNISISKKSEISAIYIKASHLSTFLSFFLFSFLLDTNHIIVSYNYIYYAHCKIQVQSLYYLHLRVLIYRLTTNWAVKKSHKIWRYYMHYSSSSI